MSVPSMWLVAVLGSVIRQVTIRLGPVGEALGRRIDRCGQHSQQTEHNKDGEDLFVTCGLSSVRPFVDGFLRFPPWASFCANPNSAKADR